MENVYKSMRFLLIAVFLTTSCTKDLELEPVSQISNASFWKSEDDAQAALYGMYARLRDLATVSSQDATSIYGIGEARSETMGFSAGSAGLTNRYFQNTLDKNFAGPSWIGFYITIHEANLILKNVPKIKFSSEATRNNILAQTYAMRAYLYFLMVKTWGDLPLRTEPLEEIDPLKIQVERTPKKEIFSFIKKDIDEAIKLFSDNKYPSGRFLWSKPAVNALKADVYLWTGKREGGGQTDLTTALNALNEVETSDVALLDDFASIFKYNNKGNREIVFAIKLDENESVSLWNGFQHAWIASYPGDVDADTKAYVGLVGGTSLWTASAALKSQFTTDDKRKNASFYEIFIYPGGVKTHYTTVIIKFPGISSGGTRKFVDDVVIYRYADILLMKAEVKNALGQDPSVEINKVRQRAYGNSYSSHVFQTGTKEKNDEAILKERLLELAFEGKRWWDLIRFGKVFELVPSLQARAGQNHLLLFPISTSILTLEPKITQNPGY